MEVASGEYGEDKVKVLVQSVKSGNCDKMIASLSGESSPRSSHLSGSSENDVPLDTIDEDTGLLLRGNGAASMTNGHVNGFIVGENEDSFNAGEIKVDTYSYTQ